MSLKLALRPATKNDVAFVERVFFESQRWLIESLFGWRGDEVERAQFGRSYDPANTDIIVVDGNDAGWMTVQRIPGHIHLDSIFLREGWRNAGIGTRLIQALILEAAEAKIPLRLSTAKINPAAELYQRLGFTVTGEDEHKVYFERRPAP